MPHISKPIAPQPARLKGDVPLRIGRATGYLSSKLHTVPNGSRIAICQQTVSPTFKNTWLYRQYESCGKLLG